MAKFNPRDRSRSCTSRKQKLVMQHNSPPKDEPWVFLSNSMLNSPVLFALSGNAYRAFFRILWEHLVHGRQQNGLLIVTHEQFIKIGICKNSVAEAIRELCAFGLVRVERGWVDGRPSPNRYTLTFYGDHEGASPTNDWKKTTAETISEYRASKAKKQSSKQKIPAPQKQEFTTPVTRSLPAKSIKSERVA